MNKTMKSWLRSLALVAGLALGGIAHAATETITYYHNDISGSPLLATDAAGAVVWKENYRPYGEKLNNAPASANNKVGFAGKPYDGNTGLSYMGARYYDPVLGRFTGIDPKEVDPNDLHSFNRYAYANNNPYKFVDPDGRMSLPAVLLGGGIILVGGGYVANCPGCQRNIATLGKGLEGFASGAVDGARNLWGIVFNESADGKPSASGAGSDAGCIYCVNGDKTKSGKDYIGSTDNLGNRQRDKSDGRDRDGAQIVDTYPKGDRDTRRKKEQQAINDRGGVDKLDNRRNEIAESKWPSKGVTPP